MPQPRQPLLGPDSFNIAELESRLLFSSWGTQAVQIGQDQAAANYPQIDGSGQTIAVIDTGTNYNHPALGGGFGPGFKVIAGYDFMTNSPDPISKDGVIPHGTATAVMAAGYGFDYAGYHYQGIAPGAKIVALRAYGSGYAEAWDWVISHRVQYNITVVEVLGPNAVGYNSSVQTLVNAGVFVSSSAGNGGPDKRIPVIPGLVRTGSVDQYDHISSFSQRGSQMSLVAPGENVALAYESDAGDHIELFSSGTSWAAPQTAGAAALIKQINPAFNEAQILSILTDSGKPIYDSVSNATYKELNINSAIALAYARSSPTPTPTPTPTHHHRSPKRAAQASAPTVGATPTPRSPKRIAQEAAAEAAAAAAAGSKRSPKRLAQDAAAALAAAAKQSTAVKAAVVVNTALPFSTAAFTAARVDSSSVVSAKKSVAAGVFA